MSIYRSLDEGIPSEINVSDDPRRRGVTAAGDYAAGRCSRRCAVISSGRRRPTSRSRRRSSGSRACRAPFVRWRSCGSTPHCQRHGADWTDPPAFRDYMFELLIDRRGGRRGFRSRMCAASCWRCARISTRCIRTPAIGIALLRSSDASACCVRGPSRPRETTATLSASIFAPSPFATTSPRDITT